MKRSKATIRHAGISFLLIFLLLVLAHTTYGATLKEKVIYPLPGPPDCFDPSAALIADAHGNLYGSTFDGGAYFLGCIFELSPNADGTWNEKTLHTFSRLDGGAPTAALVFDSEGNLYGTTEGGGTYNRGVAFELSPSSNGEWTETVLYNFGNGDDGAGPESELVFDNQGNLYGTTWGGGAAARAGVEPSSG